MSGHVWLGAGERRELGWRRCLWGKPHGRWRNGLGLCLVPCRSRGHHGRKGAEVSGLCFDQSVADLVALHLLPNVARLVEVVDKDGLSWTNLALVVAHN
ncbi:MAG: hypothetical protein ACK55I_26735, partial [bacterium]